MLINKLSTAVTPQDGSSGIVGIKAKVIMAQYFCVTLYVVPALMR